jgi:hypothetical protein
MGDRRASADSAGTVSGLTSFMPPGRLSPSPMPSRAGSLHDHFLDSEEGVSPRQSSMANREWNAFLARVWPNRTPPPPAYQSGYMQLIPLSGANGTQPAHAT